MLDEEIETLTKERDAIRLKAVRFLNTIIIDCDLPSNIQNEAVKILDDHRITNDKLHTAMFKLVK